MILPLIWLFFVLHPNCSTSLVHPAISHTKLGKASISAYPPMNERFPLHLLQMSGKHKYNMVESKHKKKKKRKRNDCPAVVYELKEKVEEREKIETKIDEVMLRSMLSLDDDQAQQDFLLKTRMLESRSYAKSEAFSSSNATSPPVMEDLLSPTSDSFDEIWNKSIYRLVVFVTSFFAFPFLTKLLGDFITMPASQFNKIASSFTPGLSIVYGTFISLTLSILYARQSTVQEIASEESSLLAYTTRNLLRLFQCDRKNSIQACQAVVDQIKIFVRGSRGKEVMGVIYFDPYARMLELVEMKEDQLIREKNGLGVQGALIGVLREDIKQLTTIRAKRLSKEALALPPTHFAVLSALTCLILLGFIIANLEAVGLSGQHTLESSFLFAILCTVYVQFDNFANDLNKPFEGVYQIRRSSIACHLLQAKWLIDKQSFGDEIEFDDIMEEVVNGDDEILINSPGLGYMMVSNGIIPPE